MNTFISEAIVLSRKRVKCPLQVSDKLLPLAEEFQYLRVLLTNEERGKREGLTDQLVSHLQ